MQAAATTQLPEITAARQSLSAGFLSAVQMELLFMIGTSPRYKGSPIVELQEFNS